ncbi:MAG: hypothetical protein WBA74_22810, partial [Cyclobacteriaceae bacterium]
MKNKIQIAILLILFSLAGVQTSAQEKTDRKVSKEKIEKLRQDEDFSYSQRFEIQEDPLERIWNWIVNKFWELVGKATSDGPVRIIFLVIVTIIIIYAILKLIGIDPSISMLHRNKESKYGGKGGVIEDVIGK